MSTGIMKGSPVGETAFPFSRMSPSMAIVPGTEMAFYIGGHLFGSVVISNLCRALFSFDTHSHLGSHK